MFITPRTYSNSQIPDREFDFSSSNRPLRFHSLTGWRADSLHTLQASEMLLLHQAGSVRVGEAVRYTVTYTPAADNIHPIPAELHVKVKNTSAIPLRAAYLHGPYSLYASCYPSTFDPNVRLDQDTDGNPQFEPYLKAGGSWNAVIPVPQDLRRTQQDPAVPESDRNVTWVIEIISQVIFSSTAAVDFELLICRDEKSIDLFSTGGISSDQLHQPAQLREHMLPKTKGEQVIATKGVYSKSIILRIDDTVSLWNKPPFPSSTDSGQGADKETGPSSSEPAANVEASEEANASTSGPQSNRRKKKIHLVVLTHGLHSNLGADMLFLKESIDDAARKAREQARHNRKRQRDKRASNASFSPDSPDDERASDSDSISSEDDDEQVIVRGFPGNAVRTERGIQYLGKRLAKYVLLMTYPDQPYIPHKNTKAKTFSRTLGTWKSAIKHLDAHTDQMDCKDHAYQITSISFIGHSLGGLIQTYAIAYIQKYSPTFFDQIKPINFIALATPFLGLSNENPVYVRFALDLGLVGRTGQDLGLSWTVPKVRSGWEAIIGGKGDPAKPQGPNSGSKPLLRILPCGPAHEVLAKFQHRTVYSNVVNDGIVPLRTSCLLFLDWKGLDRVEKARRENGLVSTMAEWGWAELTGANSNSPQTARPLTDVALMDINERTDGINKNVSIKASSQQLTGTVDDMTPVDASIPSTGKPLKQPSQPDSSELALERNGPSKISYSTLNSFFSMFRPKEAAKIPPEYKHTRIYKRSQTIGPSGDLIEATSSASSHRQETVTQGHWYEEYGLHAPPKTTFFESASDLLMPPFPPTEFIVNPASRPRTIFHDRMYHPEDIPAPLPTKRRTWTFGSSQSKASNTQPVSPTEMSQNKFHHDGSGNDSGLKVEEKIARAYHRGLSWRKVLVRLEPDAHNNIIVRRMFTNAYGWPVVKHLVDAHFGHTLVEQSNDGFEQGTEDAELPIPRPNNLDDEVEGELESPAKGSRPGELYQARADVPVAPDHEVFITSQHHQVEADTRPHEVLEDLDAEPNPSMISEGDLARWSDHVYDDGNDDSESDFGLASEEN